MAGMGIVGYVASSTSIGFLWHNLIGAAAVFVVGIIVSVMTGGEPGRRRGVMMGRPLLLALFGVIAVMVVSWTLGELLRQRRAPPLSLLAGSPPRAISFLLCLPSAVCRLPVT